MVHPFSDIRANKPMHKIEIRHMESNSILKLDNLSNPMKWLNGFMPDE